MPDESDNQLKRVKEIRTRRVLALADVLAKTKHLRALMERLAHIERLCPEEFPEEVIDALMAAVDAFWERKFAGYPAIVDLPPVRMPLSFFEKPAPPTPWVEQEEGLFETDDAGWIEAERAIRRFIFDRRTPKGRREGLSQVLGKYFLASDSEPPPAEWPFGLDLPYAERSL